MLAYMTYDISKSVYVKMFSKVMLEDPFFYSNIRKCWSHFGIVPQDSGLTTLNLTNFMKAKSLISPNMKKMYPHSGFILTNSGILLKDLNL